MSAQGPEVSVVIPCLNEEARIGRVLEALNRQTYAPEAYEVIVVDNGSTDRTREIAVAHSAKVLDQPIRSSYLARNLGIEHARFELIAFLDGDCIPDPAWLEALVLASRRSRSRYVAGRIRYEVLEINLGNRLLALRRQSEPRRKEIEELHAVPAGNMLIHRTVFERIGHFHPAISGGDIEFSKRAASAGEKIVYADDAVVRHECELSNLDYLKRCCRIRYGQEVNRAGSGWPQLLRATAKLPWRPGVGAAQRTAAAFELTSPPAIFGLWIYLWLERWASYLGAVVGAARARGGRSPSRATVEKELST